MIISPFLKMLLFSLGVGQRADHDPLVGCEVNLIVMYSILRNEIEARENIPVYITKILF